MRFWTIIGVLLAIVGTILFLNGLQSRFGASDRPAPSPGLPDLAATASRVDSASSRSPAPVDSTPAVNPSPQPTSDKPQATVTHEEIAPPVTPLREIEHDPDGRKKKLVEAMASSGWTAEEIEQLAGHLSDPRSHFLGGILVRNATFKETGDQYAHNLTPESISRSAAFLDDQASLLTRISAGEGVPPEVLVAILKVETNLGGFTGKESVFNVFWTLAMGDDPDVQREFLPKDDMERVEAKRRMVKRAAWAKKELRDLLHVARNGGENPVGIMGSFAGAFGLPQFIPSSYRAYGRDGGGDGLIDLDNLADAAASIAYYLRENGWRQDSSPSQRRKVILSYNHSGFYADCVLALADSIARHTGVSSRP